MRQHDTHLVKFFRVAEFVGLTDAKAGHASEGLAAGFADVGVGFGGVFGHCLTDVLPIK